MKTGPAPSSGRPIGCAPTSWCSTSTEGRRPSPAGPPGGASHESGRLVRGASPETTVVLWAREEDVMEVLEPASSASRLVSAPILERLRGELSSQQHVHE